MSQSTLPPHHSHLATPRHAAPSTSHHAASPPPQNRALNLALEREKTSVSSLKKELAALREFVQQDQAADPAATASSSGRGGSAAQGAAGAGAGDGPPPRDFAAEVSEWKVRHDTATTAVGNSQPAPAAGATRRSTHSNRSSSAHAEPTRSLSPLSLYLSFAHRRRSWPSTRERSGTGTRSRDLRRAAPKADTAEGGHAPGALAVASTAA